MPYIGVSPQFGVRRKHTYTATAGQTSFSGAGSEGATLSYTDSNFVDVYQNGVKLGDADYTSTSGTAIVLAQGASVDDLVEIIVFDAFSSADTVSKTDGGQFDGNITMAGTLGVTGAVTANAGVVVDNITIDGTEIDLSSGSLTIDVEGDITIDANGGDIILKDDGTEFANIANSSSDLQLVSIVSDKDIILRGNDGGSFINALTLDMSNSGDAFFNGDVYLAQYVVHKDDTDTFMQFGTDSTSFTQGNVERFEMNKSAGVVRIKPGGSNLIYFDGNGQSINSETRRGRLDIESNIAAYAIASWKNQVNNTGSFFLSCLNHSGSGIGGISQASETTLAFNTSSDYRLKENVEYDWDATTRLKQLKPCRFNWISDDTNTAQDGFLAHEVSDVVPIAINGVKDGTRDIGTIKDADGNVLQENTIEARKEDGQTWTKTGTEVVYQSIDHSKLVPLLTKALQEQQAIIESLTARITALESK